MIRINPYIVLFHELCHALIEKNLDTFGASYPDLPSCLSKFQSEEEFRVIVGTTVRQFMEFSKKLSEPSDKAEEGRAWERDKKISTEDLEKEFAEADQQESVDIPVFENIMGFIYNQAIRIDLTAVDKPSVLKIAKPKMSKEIFNYFLRIAFSGLLDPMKEFLAINGGEISMCMFNKEYAIAKVLKYIISKDNLKGFNCLVESGIIPLTFHLDNPDGSKKSLLEIAASQGAKNILNHLLLNENMEPIIPKTNSKGENLLLILLRQGKATIGGINDTIKLLIHLGVNPFGKDKDGISAFDVADLKNLYFMLKEAMRYTLANGDKKMIKQTFEFAEKYNKKFQTNIFLLKDPQTKENLLHQLLHNEILTDEEKAVFAEYLMAHDVSPKDKDINSHTFLDLTTVNQLEAILKHQAELERNEKTG